MTICPCCGFKFIGALTDGCRSCGATPVGEALPKPAHELPYYGRSLLLTVIGALMVVLFMVQVILALVKIPPVAFEIRASLDAILAAAETGAWKLKWVAIPVTIVVLWGSRKIYRSMLQSPSRYCGLRFARGGLLASALVPALIAVLIGITIPERLVRRDLGIQAGRDAAFYRADRALIEYQERFETLPSEWKHLAERLPDQDGSLAAALKDLGLVEYKTTADLAVRQKPPALQGAAIRPASLDDSSVTPPEALSFRTYEVRLPGEDRILHTDDDYIMRDGFTSRASEARRTISGTTSTLTGKP